MVVFTDSVEFATTAVGMAQDNWSEPATLLDFGIHGLAARVYRGRTFRQSKLPAVSPWSALFLVERAEESNFDLLIEESRGDTPLPDGILCLAGSGDRFHGFKGRAWSGPGGNIYLAAYLAPRRPLPHPGTCFTVLSVVSILDTIDAVPGLTGKAEIKWVNDVLIEGAKVGGVLTYTQREGDQTDEAIVGIGLNVEKAPALAPSPFVVRAGSLREATRNGRPRTSGEIFGILIRKIGANYGALLRGEYASVLARYKSRSLVVGRNISLCAEDAETPPEVIAQGRVLSLTDDLELVLAGAEKPYSKGRILLSDG